jgi:hypothetical protein
MMMKKGSENRNVLYQTANKNITHNKNNNNNNNNQINSNINKLCYSSIVYEKDSA